ncbi:MAG: uroporphyrinogen-III C-methyltransferase [Schaedlerella sp.]|nr:uroporphyrinogen-III C-methyltransferase [Schaedlerella sp.]
MRKTGKIWLAGAGPGDAGLLTIKAKELLETADVIVYDALISTEIMSLIANDKEFIYVGKRSGNHAVPQEEINQILLKQALDGKKVLRLKGGDPFVFGRGGEELEFLARHKIPFEVIPGITSAVAVAAYAGIPVTHRDYASSFHVITGHAKKNGISCIDYESLVKLQGTLVFLMGISSLSDICQGLLDAGMQPDMPAAILEKGTTSRQQVIVSDLSHLTKKAKEKQVQTPAIILVGKVCALAKEFSWTEKRTLGGKQFLITRPKQNNLELASRLRNSGAQVIEFPTISTIPFRHNHKLKDILNNIKSPEQWLVFSSPVGVRTFFKQLLELNLDIRCLTKGNSVLKIAAIGSATNKELRKYGLYADLIPSVFDTRHLGEAIAKEASSKSEILIVRAKAGSKELIPPLESAGLKVFDIPLYETIYNKNDILCEKVKSAFEQNEIDAVTFTSASTVNGFAANFPDLDYSKVQAVCIGKQTASEAEKYGMQILVAEEATMNSMIQLIEKEFGTKQNEEFSTFY